MRALCESPHVFEANNIHYLLRTKCTRSAHENPINYCAHGAPNSIGRATFVSVLVVEADGPRGSDMRVVKMSYGGHTYSGLGHTYMANIHSI